MRRMPRDFEMEHERLRNYLSNKDLRDALATGKGRFNRPRHPPSLALPRSAATGSISLYFCHPRVVNGYQSRKCSHDLGAVAPRINPALELKKEYLISA